MTVARVIPLHPDRATATVPHRHGGGGPPRWRGDVAPGFFDPYRSPASPSARHRSYRGPLATVAALLMVLAGGAGLAHHLLTPDPQPDLVPVSSAPADAGTVDWELVQGVFIPTSDVAGPTRNTGGVIGGFADTDLGAALAAAHIVYRAGAAPGPQVFDAALREQVTGPAAAGLSASVRADYDLARTAADLPDGAPLGDGSAVFLGYRVSAMPDGNKAIQVIEQARDVDGIAHLVAFDVVVTRESGTTGGEDWKVIAPSAGTWASAFTPLPDLPDGVVPFTPSSPGVSAPAATTAQEVD